VLRPGATIPGLTGMSRGRHGRRLFAHVIDDVNTVLSDDATLLLIEHHGPPT
jgi:hypothetical protein